MQRREPRQIPLDLTTWGGARKNAGRKPNGARALVSHATRPEVSRSTPVHVTLRMRPEVRGLRNKPTYRVIAAAIRTGGERFGLRVVHHSVQATHIHLIAEAENARALSRGMQGLSIRIAKRLNAHWRRHGAVLGDRYHVHRLRTPREVRHALLYVLNNARKHAAQAGVRYGSRWLDPYSSACWLEGWSTEVARAPRTGPDRPPWAPPSVWLLTSGWRRDGPLPVDAIPSRALLRSTS